MEGTSSSTTTQARESIPASGKRPASQMGQAGTADLVMEESSPFDWVVWLRLHGVDLFTLAVVGAACLAVHLADPTPTQTFPVYNLDGSLVYPHLAYPRKKQIIPVYASALLAIFVPFLFITLFQARRRSIDDWLTTSLGLLKSITTSGLFQVVIKTLIGGLRPHFYSACQPDLVIASEALAQASASQNTILPMFDRSICTGNPKHIDDALQTMPSGHATAAWAGFFFLTLYFNAQLKVISAHNPAYWKMVVLFAPLLAASLLSGYLVTDAHHHSADVLIGALIGISTALVAFRQTFASITDFRFNHILLPRASSLLHRKALHLSVKGRGPYETYEPIQAFLPRDLPFAREGGWRYGGAGEQVCGAPGDASALFLMRKRWLGGDAGVNGRV